MTKHFLTGAELARGELGGILDRAAQLRAERETLAAHRGALAAKTVALIFEHPSTRTRMSSEVAVYELGGHPMVLSGSNMQLSRGESVKDTALVTSRFVHAIGIRTGSHEIVVDLAAHSTVPVFNLLTDQHHPMQGLADLLTLQQRFGTLEGRKLAYVGDGNNVTASLMVLGAMAGMQVAVATPEGFEPEPAAVALAESVATAGGAIELTNDPQSAAAEADAVYTDVWVSMGDTDSDAKKLALAPYQLSGELLAHAKPEAIALHCLPAHVGEEITEETLYGPRSAIFDQAENRLHVQKALLEYILS
ncbi:MAG: ornithine carbamoyltransferase [Solirubrobacterales bacterium]|nr:ornithine carbamoyltransferase [Solirubrobacterales bacterium]